MEFYTEPERKIEIADRADVIVAGGGPAGYSAAIAAARNGAKTILVEQFNCLGGPVPGDDESCSGGKIRNLFRRAGRRAPADQP